MLKELFYSKFIFLMLFIEIRETQCAYALEVRLRQYMPSPTSSCETSLHYVPLRTLMVLFDQNNFRLNKTGLHMASASELDLRDVTCMP